MMIEIVLYQEKKPCPNSTCKKHVKHFNRIICNQTDYIQVCDDCLKELKQMMAQIDNNKKN